MVYYLRIGVIFLNTIFGIIIVAAVTLVSDYLSKTLPVSMPASIYGIIILFLLLQIGLVKKEKVEGVCKFLIKIMPLTFIPSAVALIDSFIDLKVIIAPVLVAIVFSTIFVMATTGKFCETLLKIRKVK